MASVEIVWHDECMGHHGITAQALAKRITLARKVRGFKSQQELAERAGLPQTQVSRLERGMIAGPDVRDLQALEMALDLPIGVMVALDETAFTRWLDEAIQQQDAEGPQATVDDLYHQRREALAGMCGADLAQVIEEWVDARLNVLVCGPDADVAGKLLDAVIGVVDGPVMAVDLQPELALPDTVKRLELRRQGRDRQVRHHFLFGQPKLTAIASSTPEELLRISAGIGAAAAGLWAAAQAASLQDALDALQQAAPLVLRDRPLGDAVHIIVQVDGDGQATAASQVLVDARGEAVLFALHNRQEAGGPVRRVAHRLAVNKPAPLPNTALVISDPLHPPAGMVPFGRLSDDEALGVPLRGLFTHLYMAGATGTGKSTMLQWLTYGIAKQGHPLLLLDPHGTLADSTLEMLLSYAPDLEEKLLVLDFSDSEFPVAFNPLDIRSAAEVEAAVNVVKEMLLKMLNLNPDSMPRAINYAEQAVWAMCEANVHGLSDSSSKLSIEQLATFFTDRDFRQLVMQFTTNRAIRETFGHTGVFEQLGPRQQLDDVVPLLRMLATLSSKDSFGNIFGQSTTQVWPEEWVRDKRVVLAKMPTIAHGNASVAAVAGNLLIGSLIGSLAKWKDDGVNAFVVVDEFQNYAGESFKELLAQTRKHGLHAIAANQSPQDLPPDVLRSVQSNTQSKMCMRLDPSSAKQITDFLAGGGEQPTAADVVALANFEGWANLMLPGGYSTGAFRFKSLPLPNPTAGADLLASRVIARSRTEVAGRRDEVWQERQQTVKRARTTLERKLRERLRNAGFDETPGEWEEPPLPMPPAPPTGAPDDEDDDGAAGVPAKV